MFLQLGKVLFIQSLYFICFTCTIVSCDLFISIGGLIASPWGIFCTSHQCITYITYHGRVQRGRLRHRHALVLGQAFNIYPVFCEICPDIYRVLFYFLSCFIAWLNDEMMCLIFSSSGSANLSRFTLSRCSDLFHCRFLDFWVCFWNIWRLRTKCNQSFCPFAFFMITLQCRVSLF